MGKRAPAVARSTAPVLNEPLHEELRTPRSKPSLVVDARGFVPTATSSASAKPGSKEHPLTPGKYRFHKITYYTYILL